MARSRCPATVTDPHRGARQCRNRTRVGDTHCYAHRRVRCTFCNTLMRRTWRWAAVKISQFTCPKMTCQAVQQRDD